MQNGSLYGSVYGFWAAILLISGVQKDSENWQTHRAIVCSTYSFEVFRVECRVVGKMAIPWTSCTVACAKSKLLVNLQLEAPTGGMDHRSPTAAM